MLGLFAREQFLGHADAVRGYGMRAVGDGYSVLRG
jgi:hypothetical protein